MEQQHHPLPEEQTSPAVQDEQIQPGDAVNTAPPRGSLPRRRTMRARIRSTVIRMTATASMVALSVILCRLLGFPQSGIWRVELGFLPIAIVGFLWGPLWSGVAYGTADLVGAAIFTGINPFITLEKVFTGLLLGAFWRGRQARTHIGLPRICLVFAIIAVLGDFLMMAVIFRFAFGYTWGAAFAFRGANAAVNLILRVLTMYLCDLRLTARLLHEGEKFGV